MEGFAPRRFAAGAIIQAMEIILYLPATFLLLILGQFLVNRYWQGLNNIPGPWLASTTNIWRLFVTLGRRPEVLHKKLHKRYGDFVQMGPNFVSITDWETVKQIWSPNSGYSKVRLPRNQASMLNEDTVRYVPGTASCCPWKSLTESLQCHR